MYVFKVINSPKVLLNALTRDQLMSNIKDKLEAIALVEEKGS